MVCLQRRCVFIPSYDRQGRLFVRKEELDAVHQGKLEPKTLILRANVGDWIEVTLYNELDAKRLVEYFDYPRVFLDKNIDLPILFR